MLNYEANKVNISFQVNNLIKCDEETNFMELGLLLHKTLQVELGPL